MLKLCALIIELTNKFMGGRGGRGTTNSGRTARAMFPGEKGGEARKIRGKGQFLSTLYRCKARKVGAG